MHTRSLAVALGVVACSALATSADGQTCRSLVRVATPLGAFEISLLDHDAPLTAGNFLQYVESGRYHAAFFHRLVSGFVLQGGGFAFQGGLSPVQTFAPIPNEFSPIHGNVARTLGVARLSDPGSGTSQWYINLVDNSKVLDFQNGGYAVFGEVTKGWSVVEAIAALPVQNFSAINQALASVPSRGPGPLSETVVVFSEMEVVRRCACYVNCDGSSGVPTLTSNDFQCFLNEFASGNFYANCDGSTGTPALTSNDFQCFLNRFAAGCS